MTDIENIRNLFFNQGYTISGIKKETGFGRKTIRKFLFKDEWNEKVESIAGKKNISKRDKYKSDIDKWLLEDKQMRKKQRHTATRVFNRLKEKNGNNFNCSYRTVAVYVAEKSGKYMVIKIPIYL